MVFGEMIRESGHPDVDLVDNMANGHGKNPIIRFFPAKSFFATLTPDQVRKLAEPARKAILHSSRQAGVAEVTQAVCKC